MANKVYRDSYSVSINRNKWLRGKEAKNKSAMLKEDNGKMCCLGFYAKACGISEKLMSNKMSPGEVTDRLNETNKRWDTWLLQGASGSEKMNLKSDSAEAIKLMRINDDHKTTDAQKEEAIKKIFNKHGVSVYFYNG